ncbi:hypothetical protein [Ornithinimicrobium kibberense]|uniref:hypothetical protein n=1 Tax=Ornithinimicrobium kibberense TaxID=282060 RepID=UPI00360F9FE1
MATWPGGWVLQSRGKGLQPPLRPGSSELRVRGRLAAGPRRGQCRCGEGGSEYSQGRFCLPCGRHRRVRRAEADDARDVASLDIPFPPRRGVQELRPQFLVRRLAEHGRCAPQAPKIWASEEPVLDSDDTDVEVVHRQRLLCSGTPGTVRASAVSSTCSVAGCSAVGSATNGVMVLVRSRLVRWCPMDSFQKWNGACSGGPSCRG